MSIEWARVEPVRGTFDRDALAHYRAMLQSLRANGLRPFVTLHHYTSPRWIAAEDQWIRDGVVEDFRRYVSFVAGELGDLVDDWNAMNEPMVYATAFALLNGMPGGRINDVPVLRKVMRNIARAHAVAYDTIKAADTRSADGGAPATVWMVQAAGPFLPGDSDKPDDERAASAYDSFWNRWMAEALVFGRVDLNFDGDLADVVDGMTEGVFDDLKGRVDGIGVNYYARTFVVGARGTLPEVNALPCQGPLQCGEKNGYEGDNKNEVYPPGIRELLHEFAAYRLPMMITENGVADASDRIRPSYVVMHLLQVQRAAAEGLDVRGYLHWSLLDNYEWLFGYAMRFGLFRVDFDTQERAERPSADVYRRIARANAVPDDLVRAHDIPAIDPL